MSQAIVNLTLPVIQKKVEVALEDVFSESLNQASTAITLQEKLVAYVVRRMPTFYVATENSRPDWNDNSINCFSQDQQHEMDQLIYEGLQHLIRRRSSWEISAQEASGGLESSPSHWFG